MDEPCGTTTETDEAIDRPRYFLTEVQATRHFIK